MHPLQVSPILIHLPLLFIIPPLLLLQHLPPQLIAVLLLGGLGHLGLSHSLVREFVGRHS